MSQSPTSPSGGGSGATGGGFFSGFMGRAARAVITSAINNTMNATTTDGVSTSRSFFDLGGGGSTDTTDSGSYQVLEYSGKNANNEIASIYPIALRAGDLILHGPRKDDAETPPSSSSYLLYNIILHATNSSGSSEKMYSLFRTDSEEEASRVFVIYKQIFPDLVKATSTSIDKQTLEKIVKISKSNQSFQAVHVAAALGMVDQLKTPTLREKFIEQEGKQLYTPLMVACVYGKVDAVKAICEDERQLKKVYDYADMKGNTIVHLAAECKDKAVGAAVLKVLKEKLINCNDAQRTSINRHLCELFVRLNNEGHAPMHLACLNNNQEAVEELACLPGENNTPLLINAQSNHLDVRSSATGNTPLHYATTQPDMLCQLLEAGCDPNVTDNDGLTPLHKAVMHGHLRSTLQLLSHSSYANFKATFDTFKEATPLHIAAYTCAIDCMKALIVFGADLDERDGNGFTARHIIASVYTGSVTMKNEALFVLAAAGAQRCNLGTGGCAEGCKTGGKNEGKKPDNWRITKDGATNASRGPPESLVREAMRGLSIVRESFDTGVGGNSPRKAGNGPVMGGRLLSLDGGGIRGLVLTQILFYMEKELGNIAGGTAAPIISYFDWVAGTSTGGILALALSCGKSVLETQSLYMKLKDKVFTGDKPYSGAKMEEFLKKEFGADRKMSSIQKPKVMIMTSLANRRPPDLYIFRNYVSPCALVGEPEEYCQFPDDTFVWETAKVTGAAPSYFTLDHELFIDGGLISNNPTLDALAELVQFKAVMMGSQQSGRNNDNGWKLPSLVLSVGTGIPPPTEATAQNLDIGWPAGVFDVIRSVPKLKDMVNLLVDQATQAEGQVVERGRAWCTSIGVPYFRFSPEMSENIELDEKRDEILVNLMWETWCYMVGNKNMIREIYERLKDCDVNKQCQNNGQQMDTF